MNQIRVLAAALLGAALMPSGARAESSAAVTVACAAEQARGGPDEALCRLFVVRISEHLQPRPVAQVARAEAADVVLWLRQASATGIVARIDRRGRAPGATQAMARADGALDEASLARFLDRLIVEAGL